MSPREWTVSVPAPHVPPVRKRKTGKLFQRKPWLNSNDRDHWRVTNPIKNGWKQNAHDAADDAALPQDLDRVTITATIQKERAGSYDAGNYYPTVKAIVDGLIDYGMCDDDNNDHVEGPYLRPGGKGPNAIILTITEQADEDPAPPERDWDAERKDRIVDARWGA